MVAFAPVALGQDGAFETSDLGLVYGQKQSGDTRETRTVGLDYRFNAALPGSNGAVQGQAWVQATDWETVAGNDASHPDRRDAWGLKLVYTMDRHRIEFSHHRLGARAGEPGTIGNNSIPRQFEQIGHPVSVCHQWSMTGTCSFCCAHSRV